MTALERRDLCGLPLTVLGFGSAPIAGLYTPVSEDDATAAVEAAIDGGIRYFDTAPFYGTGLAEMRLKTPLGAMSRDDFVLSTKVGRLVVPGAGGLENNIVYDPSPAGLARSLDESLARLGTPRADILLLHDPDRYFQGEDLKAVLAQAHKGLTALQQAGRVTAIGIGVNDHKVCEMALGVGDWDCFLLAGRYTLLEQFSLPLMDACAARGTRIIAAAPFNSGLLAGGTTWNYRPAPPEIVARAAQIRGIAADHGIAAEAAAVQFPLAHPAVVSVLSGMRARNEVQANLAHMRTPVPPGFWRAMRAAGLLADAAPVPGG